MQKYSSACTDVNSKTKKLPKLFTMQEKYCMFNTNDRVLDIGCGSETSHIKNYLRKWGVGYKGYDPYNQPEEVNTESLNWAPYDVVTLSNVLNVIAEPEVRQNLIKLAFSLIRNGWIYITVYEGDRSRVLKINEKRNSCQLNQPLAWYKYDIDEALSSITGYDSPSWYVQIKHGVIMIKVEKEE